MTREPAIERRRQIRAGLRDVYDAVPAPMHGFGELHKSAMADGALTSAHKELIALGIGIAQRCGDCVVLHVHDARRAGATTEQIHEAIGVAIMMGGGPAAIYATKALAALRDFDAANTA